MNKIVRYLGTATEPCQGCGAACAALVLFEHVPVPCCGRPECMAAVSGCAAGQLSGREPGPVLAGSAA